MKANNINFDVYEIQVLKTESIFENLLIFYPT